MWLDGQQGLHSEDEVGSFLKEYVVGHMPGL